MRGGGTQYSRRARVAGQRPLRAVRPVRAAGHDVPFRVQHGRRAAEVVCEQVGQHAALAHGDRPAQRLVVRGDDAGRQVRGSRSGMPAPVGGAGER